MKSIAESVSCKNWNFCY